LEGQLEVVGLELMVKGIMAGTLTLCSSLMATKFD